MLGNYFLRWSLRSSKSRVEVLELIPALGSSKVLLEDAQGFHASFLKQAVGRIAKDHVSTKLLYTSH